MPRSCPTTWISEGVLRELVRNRGQAARTGLAATPPADNLIMDGGGAASLAEMIAATNRGLLLTCLWYIREVDPERLLLTGLTRDGVYLIEDGEIVGAVNNFRFNESPIELLGRLTEVGASEKTLCREWNDYVNRTAMPPIRVPDFNMSTVSARRADCVPSRDRALRLRGCVARSLADEKRVCSLIVQTGSRDLPTLRDLLGQVFTGRSSPSVSSISGA